MQELYVSLSINVNTKSLIKTIGKISKIVDFGRHEFLEKHDNLVNCHWLKLVSCDIIHA